MIIKRVFASNIYFNGGCNLIHRLLFIYDREKERKEVSSVKWCVDKRRMSKREFNIRLLWKIFTYWAKT